MENIYYQALSLNFSLAVQLKVYIYIFFLLFTTALETHCNNNSKIKDDSNLEEKVYYAPSLQI